jgi:putative ABC transport system ATP-binding protein
MEPVVSIRNVDHFYGTGSLRKQVLYDINTTVTPGEIVLLTGPSGSGKTTILTLIGALRSLEHGSLRVLGHELNGADNDTRVRVRENVGFIFQGHNLLDALTARQNVQMSLGVGAKGSPIPDGDRAMAALDAVGLGDRADYHPQQLSGGQRQRVAVARALVRQPKLILADEPTASLDRASGREVIEILQKLAKRQGCSILLVTHDNRILDVADRILTLEDGRLTSFAEGLVANTGHLLTAFTQMQRKGSILHHIEKLSDRQFMEMLEQITAEFEQFLRTISLGNNEVVHATVNQVLEAVTLKLRQLTKAERATLFLVDRERGRLRSRIAHGAGQEHMAIDIPITSGIAGVVARDDVTVNIPDPYSDARFNRSVDQRTGYVTRNILCMPIHDRRKQVFAVAQLLNRIGAEAFTPEDEQRFREFAEPLGLILESCLGLHPQEAAA